MQHKCWFVKWQVAFVPWQANVVFLDGHATCFKRSKIVVPFSTVEGAPLSDIWGHFGT